ncbi:MAG: hypothetical protein M9938_05330 [Solirubrobacterales bacterium]|nr:hypothetical protein [Solirubrobacterales bacterium]
MEIKTVFLIFGIAAAVYAVLISFIGLRAKDFPSSRGVLVGLIALGAVLVIGTGTFAVKLSVQEQQEREEGDQHVPGEETTEAASATPIRIPAGLV